MSKHKFDIFDVLNKINSKQYNFYQDLSDDDKKGIVPLILMRWMSGISTKSDAERERCIMFLNEIVNPNVFNSHTHPNLLWKLLCVSSNGRNARYTWLKRNSGSISLSVGLVKQYYKYSTKEAIDSLKFLDQSDLVRMAEELGYDAAEITKIKKEPKV